MAGAGGSRGPVGPQVTEHAPLTVGTAGHIDHGKTALVKALTGIDALSHAVESKTEPSTGCQNWPTPWRKLDATTAKS